MSHPTQTAFMKDWRNRIPKEILQQDAEYYKLQDRWNAAKEAPSEYDDAFEDMKWAELQDKFEKFLMRQDRSSTVGEILQWFRDNPDYSITLTRKNQ